MKGLRSQTWARPWTISALVLWVSATFATTPPPIFSWAQRAGGSDSDSATAVSTDTNSNVYVVSTVLSSNADFGPFTFNSGSPLTKCNSQGGILWARRVGSSGYAGTLITDAAGNSYVGGSFSGTSIFDGATLNSAGLNDLYLSKFDPNGNFIWARRAGGTNMDWALNLALQADGTNLLMSGAFYGASSVIGTSTFISGMNFGNQIFVTKWTTGGTYLWGNAATGANIVQKSTVTSDPSGNVYWAGSFSGTANFGATSVSSTPSQFNTFLAKYDANGVLLDLKRLTGTNSAVRVLCDTTGNVYLIGTFKGLLTFQGANLTATNSVNGYGDVFVAKYSPAGTVLWAKQAKPGGQQNFHEVLDVSLDPNGNVFFSGDFQYGFNFGSVSLTNSGGADVFYAAAFTRDGDYLWAKSGAQDTFGSAAATDVANRLLVAGYFRGTANFDSTNLASAGSSDIYISSMDLTPPVITLQPSDQTNRPGSNVTFSATATGRTPLTYQWVSQGLAISGETNPTLVVTNLQYNRDVSLQVFSPGAVSQTRTATVTVTYFPGEELKPPTGAVLTNSPLTGPPVSGSGAACWVPDPLTRGHLYASVPGSITITWKDAATNDLIVSALIIGFPLQKFELGQEIPPPSNASLNPPPTSSVPSAVFWHEATKKLYAVAPVSNCVVTWQNGTCVGSSVNIENTWPTNQNRFQLHIANTPPVFLTNWGATTDAKLLTQDPVAGVDGASVTNNKTFLATGNGRSLLLLSPGNAQVTTNIYFQFISTIPYYEPTNLHDGAGVNIGRAIGDPFNYNTASNAAPFVFNALSRYCISFYNRATRTGPIIPVNRDWNAATNDDMVVVYYQQGLRLFEPGTGSLLGTSIAWPWKPVRYNCQWPTQPDGTIVIASQDGSGPVPLSTWSIYRQNDPSQAGYNPNEEHALKLPARTVAGSLSLDSTSVRVLEGSSVPVTVSLSSTNNLPVGNVVLSVSSLRDGDPDLGFSLGQSNVTEVTLTPQTLVTGYTFFITAGADSNGIEGTNTFTVRVSGSLFAEQKVTAREIHTNMPGLVVSPYAFGVPEGGTRSISVRLTQPPAANLAVNVRRDLSTDPSLTIQGSGVLNFTPGNWDQLQTVTIAAAEDGDFFNSTSNKFYLEASGAFSATNTIFVDQVDNDVPPDAVFALRSDLGDLPGTANPQYSEPYVLVAGTNNLNQPAMLVYRVVAEQPTNLVFRYSGVAGRQIQPPYPLSLMVGWEQLSTGVSGPYWQDRKKFFWAKSAGDNGGSADVVMRFFYPVQNGFDFPKLGSAPPVGSLVPWLDDLAGGTHGQPVNITYQITWPAPVPELRVAESLIKPKFGLPAISGQTSVEVIYQQSVANDAANSVSLMDPTFTYSATMTSLPSDLTGKVATNLANGNIFFVNLPPHLRGRLWFEPINQKLKFKGEFRAESGSEEPAGYLLLNVLTSRDKSFLLDPASMSADPNYVAAVNNLAAQAGQARLVSPNGTFDSLALSAGLSQGSGYVTLAFNNATNSTTLPPGRGTPISLEIIRVNCPTYRGEVKVVTSDNPLDEKLTLRHSGDFSGKADNYIFEWKYRPPPNGGTKPTVEDLDHDGQPDGWLAYPTAPANGQGALDITVGGSGLQTLVDNWYICRYRSTNINYPCGTNWSAWTEPALAEGWIKRALAGINPFEQKFDDYSTATVDTIVNMISQAGARSLGAVPLDAAALNNYGLIEIYETILKRGMELSVDGNPPVSDPAANKALLGAARRLADLCLLLGNEAYADASDPTIGFGTDGQYANETAPSIFCFMDQVSSLLEEELGLMRGLDDSFGRNVRQYPAYNHLRWNFTRNITGGEVAYALNYNIRAQAGSTNISAATARQLYPQGHGDAWGQYLSAIKYYYRLLRNPNFDWNPDIEFVTLGGIGEPIPVNYLDERKFAKIAAAKAQTGAEIVNLTYRSFYSDDPSQQWQGYLDTNTNRAWGVSDWASRAGQGAFLDWAVGNALLPATSTNQGIQKVDRTTVTELRETAAAYLNIQEQVDKADAGLNPLGLVNNVVPFDINPNEIDNNTTHFEQIYTRAVRALNNAIAVFNYANNSSQLLRRQADAVSDFQKVVADKEADFKNRLIETFGYPYSDDIGPLGAYASGYDGPDLYHYMYVDPSRLLGIDSPPAYEYLVQIVDTSVASDGSLLQVTNTVKYHVAPNGFGFIKPPLWVGARRAPGELQLAQLDLLQAKARFERALAEYDNLLGQIQNQSDLLQAQYALDDQEINIINATIGAQQTLNDEIRQSRIRQLVFQNLAQKATLVANALAEANPKVLGVIAGLAGGVIADPTSPLRSAIQLSGAVVSEVMRDLADSEGIAQLDHEQAKEEAAAQESLKLTVIKQDQAILQQVAQLEQLVRQEVLLRLEIYNQQEALQQASGRYSAALARGQRLLEDRLRFRQQTAEQIQSYRYKDMAFRIFRNDALQKYRAQFDLAAMYVYLAAKAYDFDTNLRPNDPSHAGSFFINKIVRARSLGLIQNGLPQTGGLGDPGLADPMAAMSANFAVLKTQLGFDNIQQSAREFSLRSQLFRISSDAAGNPNWREALKRFKVDNILVLPDFRRNCLFSPTQPQEPGLIIPIATTIDQDLNLFGWPAGAGDSSFNPTAFSTKVRSGGVTILNYRISGIAGLRQDPRVYLVPVGADIMRSPRVNSFDSINYTREWRIQDQWLPAPFPISDRLDPRLLPTNWIPALDLQVSQGFSLSQLAEVRAHASFDAYYPGYPNATQDDPQFESTRIIGRSVWNTRWLLVIPAVNLLSTDRQEALARFIDGGVTNSTTGARDLNGVTDIRLRFKTYAYTGR